MESKVSLLRTKRLWLPFGRFFAAVFQQPKYENQRCDVKRELLFAGVLRGVVVLFSDFGGFVERFDGFVGFAADRSDGIFFEKKRNQNCRHRR